jgi:flotillin
LEKYAVLLTGDGMGSPGKSVDGRQAHVQNIVKGIIEGETRSVVSTMTMEELLKERRIYRDKVIAGVQTELEQFGLCIYNANVKELQDTPGSEYFAYLSRKAHEGALNQARVDVAEARMKGEVGEAQRQGEAKQEIAKINADTAIKETERKADKAQADATLTNKEISIEKTLNLARIEAKRAAETKDTELQKTLEVKRAEMELERQRATTVTKAIIQRESDQQKADSSLYTQQKDAEAMQAKRQAETDAAVYREKREAEAHFFKVKQDALADFERAKLAAEARKTEADAKLHVQKQEAAAMVEMAKAYGHMAQVLGGPENLIKWKMLEMGTFERLAHENAAAIKGLQPKINVWNTGSNADSMDATAPIRNLFQSLPPLLSTIQDQTGLMPPTWLAQMPQKSLDDLPEIKGRLNGAGTNGALSHASK